MGTFTSNYTLKSLFSTFFAQCSVGDNMHVFSYPSCRGHLMMRYDMGFLEFVKRFMCHNLHNYAHARGLIKKKKKKELKTAGPPAFLYTGPTRKNLRLPARRPSCTRDRPGNPSKCARVLIQLHSLMSLCSSFSQWATNLSILLQSAFFSARAAIVQLHTLHY